MACSHSGVTGHNIQTCGSVRRCGHCGGHGHDRRNCRVLADSLAPAPHTAATVERCSTLQLVKLCTQNPDCLVHLYWPSRAVYFFENFPRLNTRGHWLLVATSGHGVFNPERPTINFLLANNEFTQGFPTASRARSFNHGVMFHRAAIENSPTRPATSSPRCESAIRMDSICTRGGLAV